MYDNEISHFLLLGFDVFQSECMLELEVEFVRHIGEHRMILW
jgi:hypothetical protein